MSIDAAKIQADRVLCEDSHLYFTRRFFKPRMGFKFSVNWHHEYIAWAIDEVIKGNIKNLVVNVPPGAGKTELTTNLIARGLALNPRSRFLYLSYSQTLVEDVSATARNIVKSEEFQKLWLVDISTDTDAKSNWKTNVDGFAAGHVYAASMGGQVTGRRAGTLDNGFTGAIILDDPLKPEDAFSKTTRDKANRKILNTVNSRKAKSDIPIILIMQRLHTEDPTGFILLGNLPSEFTLISIPALIDDDYISTLPPQIQKLVPECERDNLGRQSYWPQKETLESLLQLEKGGGDKDGVKISKYTFSSQYMQRPTMLGGDIIKGAWFGRYPHQALPPIKYRKIYADTAQKTKEHNDYSVFECWGYGGDNKIYLIDLIRGKWEAPELKQNAIDFWNKHKAIQSPSIGILREMAVEDKASGTGLIQDIRKEAKIPIKPIQRNTDKLTRIMDVLPMLESGYIMLPDESPWVSDFISECESFTANDTHDFDDQIDPMIDAINDVNSKQPMKINPELLRRA